VIGQLVDGSVDQFQPIGTQLLDWPTLILQAEPPLYSFYWSGRVKGKQCSQESSWHYSYLICNIKEYAHAFRHTKTKSLLNLPKSLKAKGNQIVISIAIFKLWKVLLNYVFSSFHFFWFWIYKKVEILWSMGTAQDWYFTVRVIFLVSCMLNKLKVKACYATRETEK
jgi:hypothetical protein